MKFPHRQGFLVIAISSLLVVACSNIHPLLTVKLGTPTATLPVRFPPQPTANAIRVALAPVLSPQVTALTYSAFSHYLQNHLGEPVDLVQQRTYEDTNELLESGGAQLGLVCSLPYVVGHDQFGLQLLATPDTGQGPFYYSYLIVPASSPAHSLADLRGSVFAFSDPLSDSGHLVPLYEISILGEDPLTFFRQTFFTYGHDNSIRAVADGLADGAAVDSMVYDSLVSSDPTIAHHTRVIAKWGPFAAPPMVVPPTVSPQLKSRLQQILLSMPASDKGRQILRRLGIKQFEVVPDSAYGPIRQMWSIERNRM